MTDRDWFTSSDPTAMLRLAADRITDRKLRLYAVGCCRRVWHLVQDRSLREALRTAEWLADGQRSVWELNEACRPLFRMYGVAEPHYHDSVAYYLSGAVLTAAAPSGEFDRWRRNMRSETPHLPDVFNRLDGLNTLAGVLAARADGGGEPRRDIVIAQERAAQADLLRCVVGDPFTVSVPDPRWLTDTVLALARRVYDRRDFAALPILADALEDAGCADDALLAHCRHGREHARGCWAVDLLLGKG